MRSRLQFVPVPAAPSIISTAVAIPLDIGEAHHLNGGAITQEPPDVA